MEIVVGAAVAAWLSKDALNKLLGPTAEYLGDELKAGVEKRLNNVGRIFENATKKVGNAIEKPGSVSPRLLRNIVSEGSWADQEICVEYFGGVLASSRANQKANDRGLRYSKMIEKMSTDELRLHFFIYSAIKNNIPEDLQCFINMNREQMQIFIPAAPLLKSMYGSFDDESQTSLVNSLFALHQDGLIEGIFRIAQRDSLKKLFEDAPSDGLIVQPSAPGVHLFLWAFGRGGRPLSELFAKDFIASIPGVNEKISGVLLTRPMPKSK